MPVSLKAARYQPPTSANPCGYCQIAEDIHRTVVAPVFLGSDGNVVKARICDECVDTHSHEGILFLEVPTGESHEIGITTRDFINQHRNRLRYSE